VESEGTLRHWSSISRAIWNREACLPTSASPLRLRLRLKSHGPHFHSPRTKPPELNPVADLMPRRKCIRLCFCSHQIRESERQILSVVSSDQSLLSLRMQMPDNPFHLGISPSRQSDSVVCCC
jgi:hypothetical protein